MLKKVRSWSKPDNLPGLIGRKEVDKSTFAYGSHIPIEFRGDFEKANGGFHVELNEKKEVTLLYKGKPYSAFLNNLARSDYSGDTLELNYGSNREFKKNLVEAQPRYLDLYETGKPFVYRVELIGSNTKSLPKVWWVNQGKTLKAELEGGFLWAPLKSSNGATIYHWETMAELQEDDIVLNYANGELRYVSRVVAPAVTAPKPKAMEGQGWEEEGRLVKVEYHALEPSIDLKKFANKILALNIDQGPIHSGQGIKQGYLFRFSQEGLKIIQELQPETSWPEFTKVDSEPMIESVEIEEKPMRNISAPKELIKHLYSYISSKGFTYTEADLKNFYLSIKAKPFVILAGISGTGKTKLVRFFAEAIGATKENGRYNQIAVRPDWNDSSDLLGYNDINGNFKPGPITTVIKKANEEPEFPYIVCLDEMNLSRVEYYFSDFLSLIETRDKDGYSDTVFKPEYFMNEEDRQAYSALRLPPNLYIIGTVNMDETTFPFSKKVLDRANTIEFSDVDLTNLGIIVEENIDILNVNNQVLKPEYTVLKDCLPEYKEVLQRVIERLQAVNEILQEANLHIGYRVRDEVCFYIIYNKKFELLNEEDAFDYQLMQKILPRLQGSSNGLRKVLIKLFKIATGKDLSRDEYNAGEEALKHLNEADEIKPYPRTAKKLANMIWRFDDGFTSFWS